MPLRSAPLPRMAGHLSFMRAQQKELIEVGAGDVAILGLPFEDPNAANAGQSLAPRALRETSVYFGWHANPQFSHPIDIDLRNNIETTGLHDRLCDLGDIPSGSDCQITAGLQNAVINIEKAGANAIILGGSSHLVKSVKQVLEGCQIVQLGGFKTCENSFAIAPVSTNSRHFGTLRSPAETSDFQQWRDPSRPLLIQFDLSVFQTSISVLCDQPRLDGLDLPKVVQWLRMLGRENAQIMFLTGLNPSRPGMGLVKVGQRLMVTALLPFIYSRLGFDG